MQPEPELFSYGIQEEQSHVRVHVSPATKRLYVFQTAAAQDLLASNGEKYRTVQAFQEGVSYATAEGKVVPWRDIPGIQVVNLESETWWVRFLPTLSTTMKGRRATAVVLWALRHGRMPLWISDAKEPSNVQVQRKGTDIEIWAHIRIQVKCDWDAGPTELGGSGNLFLQLAERNPRRRH